MTEENQISLGEEKSVLLSLCPQQIPNKLCPGIGLGGLVVSMLASDTQVCGFKPGPSR